MKQSEIPEFKFVEQLPSTFEPGGTVWQGQEWQALNDAYGQKNWSVAIEREDSTLAFAAIYIKNPKPKKTLSDLRKWVNYYFFPQLVVDNGPAIQDRRHSIAIHERFCQLLSSPPFSKYRLQWISLGPEIYGERAQQDIEDVYASHGFECKMRHTYLLDLQPSLDELWKGVHPKRRNRVNRAKRDGIQVEEVQDESGLRRYWEIRKQNWARNNFEALPFDYFKATWDSVHPSGAHKVFISHVDGQDLAGQLVFASHNAIELAGVAISDANIETKLAGNEGLQWEIIRWCKEQNYRYLNYVGATPESQDPKLRNIDRFKASWGGKLHSFQSFSRQPAFLRKPQ